MKAEVYEVVSLFEENARKDSPLQQAAEHYIEGSLDGYHIVAVPTTISNSMAANLKADLEKELGSPVIVITRNTKFMKIRKLSPGEAAKVVGEVQDITHDRAALMVVEGGDQNVED